MAIVLGIATLIAMAAVSAATPFLTMTIAALVFRCRAFSSLPRFPCGSHHGGGVFWGLRRERTGPFLMVLALSF